jgi:hypothetical protein
MKFKKLSEQEYNQLNRSAVMAEHIYRHAIASTAKMMNISDFNIREPAHFQFVYEKYPQLVAGFMAAIGATNAGTETVDCLSVYLPDISRAVYSLA